VTVRGSIFWLSSSECSERQQRQAAQIVCDAGLTPVMSHCACMHTVTSGRRMVISHEIAVKRCEGDLLTLKYSNLQRGRWPCWRR
jgi:hypothetical protein